MPEDLYFMPPANLFGRFSRCHLINELSSTREPRFPISKNYKCDRVELPEYKFFRETVATFVMTFPTEILQIFLSFFR